MEAASDDDCGACGGFGGHVLGAVAAGESAELVRHAIEECAQGSATRRVAAVNEAGEDAELPLQAAHDLRRGDLVGLLLEAGANARALKVFGTDIARCDFSALGLCCAHGRVESVRVLLRDGHETDEYITYIPFPHFESQSESTAAHVCIAPPLWARSSNFPSAPAPSLRLACLEALLQGGADANALTISGETPLHYVALDDPDDGRVPFIDLLVRYGADVNKHPWPPIFGLLHEGDSSAVQCLLGHGASADVAQRDGTTPLLMACVDADLPGHRDVLPELLRLSSAETRRGVDGDGSSAVDVLVSSMGERDLPLEPWHKQLIVELLVAKAPVLPENMGSVLPIVAERAQRRQDELAARRSEPRGWRAQEQLVGLALDFGELRETDRTVEERRVRLAALEREAGSTESDNSSGGEEEDDEEGKEEGESCGEEEEEDEEDDEAESGDDDTGSGSGAEGGAESEGAAGG
jgi:hypothetical protein